MPAKAEWANLEQALAGPIAREQVVLERLERATLDALRRRLRQGEYHVFQFIGHGGFNEDRGYGALWFEDEQKGSRLVSGEQLGIVLHNHWPLRLAVLNACEGGRGAEDDPFAGTAQALVQQGIPAVIAMQFPITMPASATFAREFYTALGDGYPVDAAVTEARTAIRLERELEWATPVLFLRAPDGHIFDVGSAPGGIREAPILDRPESATVAAESEQGCAAARPDARGAEATGVRDEAADEAAGERPRPRGSVPRERLDPDPARRTRETAVFRITVQRGDGDRWPVFVDYRWPASQMEIRRDGQLHIDRLKLAERLLSPREYGIALGEALFRDGVREAFVLARSSVAGPLRVVLTLDDSGLRALRWEWLCAPGDHAWDFLATDERTPFSFEVASPSSRRFDTLGRDDLRALVVIASPEGLDAYGMEPLDTAPMVARLEEALRDVQHEMFVDPTLDGLCDRIAIAQPTLLHIVCNSRFASDPAETVLYFARGNQSVDPVTGSSLTERLGRLNRLPQLIALVGCETAPLAVRLVRDLGIPAVVGMAGMVSVQTAETLVVGFYRRLLEHGEPDRALNGARGAVAERHDAFSAVLYSRSAERSLFAP